MVILRVVVTMDVLVEIVCVAMEIDDTVVNDVVEVVVRVICVDVDVTVPVVDEVDVVVVVSAAVVVEVSVDVAVVGVMAVDVNVGWRS